MWGEGEGKNGVKSKLYSKTVFFFLREKTAPLREKNWFSIRENFIVCVKISKKVKKLTKNSVKVDYELQIKVCVKI